MTVLLGTIFVASLLGSLHCVGMCGPFALMASSHNSPQSGLAWRATAIYSLGRLVTYAMVGLVFGSLGMALNRGTAFAPWQQTATYVAGGLMILVGLVALARQLGWRLRLPSLAGRLQTILNRLFQVVRRQPPLRKAFLIGALTCLMPCGWLYAFAIVAAGTGNPLWGALVMIVFWSGTVPVMVTLALGLGKLGQSVQRRIPLAMACLVILVGMFTLTLRAPVAIGDTQAVVRSPDELLDQVLETDQAELPCCQKP